MTSNTEYVGLTDTVKDALVTSVIGTGNNVQTIASAVSRSLAKTITDIRRIGPSVMDAIDHFASGALRGAALAGVDLRYAAKGIMLGVLRGTTFASAEARDTIGQTAYVVIRNTSELGGNLEAAAIGLVRGAIAGAQELGLSAQEAAEAAANGALKAAGQVGSTAVAAVRKAVSKTIPDVKILHKEPEAILSCNN